MPPTRNTRVRKQILSGPQKRRHAFWQLFHWNRKKKAAFSWAPPPPEKKDSPQIDCPCNHPQTPNPTWEQVSRLAIAVEWRVWMKSWHGKKKWKERRKGCMWWRWESYRDRHRPDRMKETNTGVAKSSWTRKINMWIAAIVFTIHEQMQVSSWKW